MRSVVVGTVFGLLLVAAGAVGTLPAAEPPHAPPVGGKAPNFALPTVGGQRVELTQLVKKGRVVLVVLRGFPGYQCPACTAQTGQLLGRADELGRAGAAVVLVYPGAAEGLPERARDFARDKSWPANVHLVLDPDYALTMAYGLRWDAPRETAYPATFVIDRQQVVRYAKVSTSHGGRAPVEEVLAALEAQ